MMCPLGKTTDGHEMQFGTNHLGHFLLTILLLPKLTASKAKIMNVSSFGHNMIGRLYTFNWERVNATTEALYNLNEAYGYSKLANIWFTRELQRRYGAQGVNAYALHPGAVRTDLGRHMDKSGMMKNTIVDMILGLIMKSAREGAQTSLFCAVSPDAVPGEYHEDCHPTYSSREANDDALAKELWEKSEKWVNEKAPL